MYFEFVYGKARKHEIKPTAFAKLRFALHVGLAALTSSQSFALLSDSGLRPSLKSARIHPILLSWSDGSNGLERIETKIPESFNYIRKYYYRQMIFFIIGFCLIQFLPWINTARVW